MSIFENDDYKQVMRLAMKSRQEQFGGRFTYKKMANVCGIQKTYLSKVLNSSSNLNPDQLFSACEYLKLKSSETEFVLLLREINASDNVKRVDFLRVKIKKIRNDNLKTESAIEVVGESSVDNNKWEYYTDIDLQLVHMFMTIPLFLKNPNLICPQIGVSLSRLQSILLKLQNWKILRFENSIYTATDPKLHLSEDSPVFLAFGILNRIKTIEKIRQSKTDSSEDYFFSVIFSASKKLQSKFKKKILDVLKDFQNEVIKDESEEVYQLNIDFFKWS